MAKSYRSAVLVWIDTQLACKKLFSKNWILHCFVMNMNFYLSSHLSLYKGIKAYSNIVIANVSTQISFQHLLCFTNAAFPLFLLKNSLFLLPNWKHRQLSHTMRTFSLVLCFFPLLLLSEAATSSIFRQERLAQFKAKLEDFTSYTPVATAPKQVS